MYVLLGLLASRSQPAPPTRTRQVVMMGNTATGKSSLVSRFTKDVFLERPSATIGSAFASKDVM
jgi:GTPase SAR1 family protein